MQRREILKFSIAGFTLAAMPLLAYDTKDSKDSYIIIKNAKIFDGINILQDTQDILIKNAHIEKVGINLTIPHDSLIIDAKGKFAMPGLIDCHWHVLFAAGNPSMIFNAPDSGLLYANAVKEAERTVLRGFTTVRDMAGSVFGLQKAIDSHIFKGPKIFPSGSFISQTSGHGDFGAIYDKPRRFHGNENILESIGAFRVADGISEVLTATREQLKRGATQIKIGAGGGVVSDFDPLDSTQYLIDEMKAVVSAANDWGTYVCAHVYNDKGIHRCLDAGIKSIEHGQLASEDSIKRMADNNVWLSLQAFEYNKFWQKPLNTKGNILNAKWRKVLEWAVKHKCPYAFGTDAIFNPTIASGQNYYLTMFADILGNLDTLRMATSGNAKLVELCGERNPYKQHKIGRIIPNAWADILLIDGNPIQNVHVLEEYENNFKCIIKNGEIIKNIL